MSLELLLSKLPMNQIWVILLSLSLLKKDLPDLLSGIGFILLAFFNLYKQLLLVELGLHQLLDDQGWAESEILACCRCQLLWKVLGVTEALGSD